jgi:hypothetical protein
MSESTSPLDRRLVAVLGTDDPVPSEVRGRVRARLEGSIPAMAQGPGGQGGAAGGAPGRGLRAAGLHTVAIAAFLAGGVTGAALFAAMSQTPPPRLVYVDRPVPQAAAPVAVAMAPIAPIAPPAPIAPAVPVLAARPAPAFPAAAPPAPAVSALAPRASRFAEERRLLDDARAGLLRGEPELALEQLDAHRARFADGLLSEERDAMQVEALVRAGRPDEARERASAFRVRRPASLFLPTVESAMASIP